MSAILVIPSRIRALDPGLPSQVKLLDRAALVELAWDLHAIVVSTDAKRPHHEDWELLQFCDSVRKLASSADAVAA